MRNTPNAFTRIEIAAVIAALGLLCALAAPLFGSTRSDGQRALCFNNLRLIGRGVQTWAADHTQRLPWWTPTTDGGEFSGLSRPGNAWVEYAFISNELVAPKILACASDAGVRRAEEWSQFFTFRSSALSYSLHLHASTDSPGSWLSADRNLRANAFPSGCSSGINNVHGTDPFLAQWTNAVHGGFGHLVLMDGSVEFTSSQRLKELLLSSQAAANGPIHILKAR